MSWNDSEPTGHTASSWIIPICSASTFCLWQMTRSSWTESIHLQAFKGNVKCHTSSVMKKRPDTLYRIMLQIIVACVCSRQEAAQRPGYLVGFFHRGSTERLTQPNDSDAGFFNLTMIFFLHYSIVIAGELIVQMHFRCSWGWKTAAFTTRYCITSLQLDEWSFSGKAWNVDELWQTDWESQVTDGTRAAIYELSREPVSLKAVTFWICPQCPFSQSEITSVLTQLVWTEQLD